MLQTTATTVLAVLPMLCLVLAAVSSLPQCLLLLRTRDSAGLSGSAVVLAGVTESAWLSYSVLLHRTAVIPADVVYLLGALALLVAAARVAAVGAGAWLSGVAWTALLVASAAVGFLVGLRLLVMGELLAAAVVVEGVPQLVTALRAEALSGLSGGSQWLYLFGGVAWAAYGVLVGDRPFLSYGILQVLVVAPVLWRLHTWQATVPPVPAVTSTLLVPQRSPSPADERVHS